MRAASVSLDYSSCQKYYIFLFLRLFEQIISNLCFFGVEVKWDSGLQTKKRSSV